jgi:hypothetical protein
MVLFFTRSILDAVFLPDRVLVMLPRHSLTPRAAAFESASAVE